MAGLNEKVRNYWEAEVCGTDPTITAAQDHHSLAWFQAVERNRYEKEPMIHAVAQFTRHKDKMLLEIGVGAGTDHLQWARAGAICHGVDLTEAAIATARRHLAHYGLESNLQRCDAEKLPFADGTFDIVYSWGVIHHSESPEKIVAEVRRVLRPGGAFIGMFYHRRSLVGLKWWIKFGLLKGRPFRSLGDCLYHHMESIGTKTYELRELSRLFFDFSRVEIAPHLTPYDLNMLPRWMTNWLPAFAGFFLAVRAEK